jgi:hypothetical protein
MLSQARGLSFDVMPSALEAALLEPDEIKRHRPPYNVALTVENRSLWFASPNLTARRVNPTSQCPLGPFSSAGMLDAFGALATAESGALGSSRWRPDPITFEAGYARLRAVHPELSRHDLGARDNLLRLGTRLWREGRRDREVDVNAPPPIPPGCRRPVAARRDLFTLASFDRMRVLTTELKRLMSAGAPVALRLGVGPALDASRLASALWWV